MPNIPSLEEMLKCGLHFGHKTSKRHPSMEKYIYTVRNTVHIFDLEKTQQELQKALEFIKEVAAKGGVILFLGTKKQGRDIIKKYAEETNMPYIARHWLGGTFTNFKVIHKLIEKLEFLEKQEVAPDYEQKYTKKERLKFSQEKEKLLADIGGIRQLGRLPEVLYLIDAKGELTAIREAKRKKVPIVAMCDTNVEAENIDYVVPANDDAVKSIELVTRLVAEAIKEGQEEAARKTIEEVKVEEKV